MVHHGKKYHLKWMKTLYDIKPWCLRWWLWCFGWMLYSLSLLWLRSATTWMLTMAPLLAKLCRRNTMLVLSWLQHVVHRRVPTEGSCVPTYQYGRGSITIQETTLIYNMHPIISLVLVLSPYHKLSLPSLMINPHFCIPYYGPGPKYWEYSVTSCFGQSMAS